jgi:hypothetical protein
MAKQQICELGYNNAINAIKGTDKVYFRRGVWNEYELISTEKAINKIINSGYGADIYVEDGKYYVSCPSDSDMW